MPLRIVQVPHRVRDRSRCQRAGRERDPWRPFRGVPEAGIFPGDPKKPPPRGVVRSFSTVWRGRRVWPDCWNS